MAKVKKYSDDNVSMRSVWDDSGDKRYGFASKDKVGDRTRYGVGIDNMGNPYRGYYEKDVNTPLGTLDYGYDGDTVFGGITPNLSIQNYPGMAALMSGNNRLGFVNSMPNGGINVGIDNVGSPYRGAYDGQINTPLGQVGYGYDGDTSYANVSPNYYMQALANLLMNR